MDQPSAPPRRSRSSSRRPWIAVRILSELPTQERSDSSSRRGSDIRDSPRLSIAAADSWPSRRALRDASLDELADESGGQWTAWFEANRAFARVICLELFPEDAHRQRARVEGAMPGGRAKGDQPPSVQAEGRNSIADDLLRFRRGGADRFTKFLERGSLLGTQRLQIFVDGLGPSGHCRSTRAPDSARARNATRALRSRASDRWIARARPPGRTAGTPDTLPKALRDW